VERKGKTRDIERNAIAGRLKQSGHGLNMARNAEEGIKDYSQA